METLELEDPGYWDSEEPDIRFNPVGPPDQQGLVAFAGREPRLRGHVLLATSGTREAPRWIAVSRKAILASAAAVNAHLEVGNSDHWLLALPDFHVGGLGVHARAHLAGCEVSVFEGRWRDRVEAFAETCGRGGVTLTALTPTQVFDLVRAGIPAPDCLRAVVVGGGGLDRRTGRRARRLGWPVLQSYGMTEACSQIATESIHALEEPFQGSWLPVLTHWDVRLGDDDRLWIRGEALFSGSIQPDGAGEWRFAPAALDEDGFFRTADRVKLSELDGQARLQFAGRSDDEVKVLGELVSLVSLRRRWESIVGSKGLAGTVVALPDERRGHRLWGVIEGTAPGPTVEKEWLARFNSEVAPYERIDRVAWIEVLPRTAIGKIAMGRLCDELAAD